jgi:hypothetical protein
MIKSHANYLYLFFFIFLSCGKKVGHFFGHFYIIINFIFLQIILLLIF